MYLLWGCNDGSERCEKSVEKEIQQNTVNGFRAYDQGNNFAHIYLVFTSNHTNLP